MSDKPYAAIILAAGLSSRMEQFKPLLSIGEETISSRLISTFLNNDVEVYLVTGYRSDELRKAVQNPDITIVENKDYEKGMFSSVQAGIRALKPGHKAFFISPVDIPLVRPFTIKQLIASFEARPDKIHYPVFRGKRGHPPLIPTALAPAIQGWDKEGGLRALLDSYKAISAEVSVPDRHILMDIDTSEDYKGLVGSFGNYDVPTEEECRVILKDVCKVSSNVQKHSAKVAEVAVVIGKALISAGCKVDLEVINAASLLHDIAKGQKIHATEGGRMLLEMGFKRIGEIVSIHTDLPGSGIQVSIEAKIVHLADKFVSEDNLVTIDQRFDPSRFKNTPEAQAKVRMRKQQAIDIKKELEILLGYPIEIEAFNGR